MIGSAGNRRWCLTPLILLLLVIMTNSSRNSLTDRWLWWGLLTQGGWVRLRALQRRRRLLASRSPGKMRERRLGRHSPVLGDSRNSSRRLVHVHGLWGRRAGLSLPLWRRARSRRGAAEEDWRSSTSLRRLLRAGEAGVALGRRLHNARRRAGVICRDVR